MLTKTPMNPASLLVKNEKKVSFEGTSAATLMTGLTMRALTPAPA